MLPQQFRKKLVKEILLSVDPEQVPAWKGRRGPGRPFTRIDNNSALRLTGRHFPEKMTGTGKKSNITRSCVVCQPAERSKFQREQPGQ